MKRITLTLISLIVLLSFANAQTYQRKEKKYKWGCAVAVNSINGQMGFPGLVPFDLDENGNRTSGGNRVSKSFSISVIPKYLIADDLMLRLEIGRTSINQQVNTDYIQTAIHYKGNLSVKESITRIVPSLQWNYAKKKFFEAYGGMSLSYINYGRYSENAYTEFRDSVGDILTFWEKSNDAIDGGYATGIGGFMGFNIYLQKHISVGAEFSSSYLYYKIGGKYSYDHVYQSVPNPPVNIIYNQTVSYKGFRFSNILSSFNISIWF